MQTDFFKHKTVQILLILGLAAGFLGGLLGIGGGALIVPGLVFFLALNQHRAHGTSLLCALMIGTAGMLGYWSQGNINLPLAGGIALGGVFGALIGVRICMALHSRTLRQIFCLFLVFVGIRLIFCGFGIPMGESCNVATISHGSIFWAQAIGVGIVTGIFSGMLGIGGGIVMIPAMVIILGVPQHVAQGVSLAAIIPTALSGMIMHSRRGNVDFKVGGITGAAAVVGVLAGSMLAGQIETGTLQFIFGVFVIIMSALMALKK